MLQLIALLLLHCKLRKIVMFAFISGLRQTMHIEKSATGIHKRRNSHLLTLRIVLQGITTDNFNMQHSIRQFYKK